MRIGPPAEHHLGEMPGIMGKPVDAGVAGLQPPGEEIDGERKAVHLRKQGDQERTERSERSPVAIGPRLEEAVGKKNEDQRVDDHQSPEPVGRRRGVHDGFLSSLLR